MTREEISWVIGFSELIIHSPKGTELCRQAGGAGYSLVFQKVPSTCLGSVNHDSKMIRIDSRISIPSMAKVLIHECSHVEQKLLGLENSPKNQTFSDYILGERIAEAATRVHELESSWDMSTHSTGMWAKTYFSTPLLSLNMDFHLASGDSTENRDRARAAMFKAFFSDQLAEIYETSLVNHICEMLPRKTLLLMGRAPKRNPDQYNSILELHGIRNLKRFLPELDWENPFWCGIRTANHERLEETLYHLCIPTYSLPPASYNISRTLAPIYAPINAAKLVMNNVQKLTPYIKPLL